MSKKKTEPIKVPTIEQVAAERNRLKYKSRYIWTLRSTISVLVVVAAIAILVATIWMPVLQIHGTSMGPTLNDGDIVISIKKLDLKQGDLVAFYYGNKLLIKRNIAGPGQWVNIDEAGNIYVDDVLLNEPYIEQKALGECDIELPYQVPDGRWFLVGDSRALSVDSRSSQVGCIAQEQIIGKIVIRVWPISQFGTLH